MKNPEYGILTDPLWQREIRRCEGDPNFFLGEEKLDALLVYISHPLSATTRVSPFENIMRAVDAAYQIVGTTYQGRKVMPFIPHITALSIWNELVDPVLRVPAMMQNVIHLGLCDALVVVGPYISPGMQKEILKAQELGLPIMTFASFKKQLTDLPSLTEEEKATVLRTTVNHLGRNGLITHELFQRKPRRSKR